MDRPIINFSIFPNEVIEQILMDSELSFIDVSNFGSVSSRYWDLVNKSNLIWRTKFKQMWPRLMAQEFYKNRRVENWREEFRQRLLIGQQTLAIVKEMSSRYIKYEELSNTDFAKFEQLNSSCSHELSIHFMIDELMCNIHHKDRNANLTVKYYSEKVLRHLRQTQLTRRWEQFRSAAAETQLLEHGAVIVAQWSQPAEDITEEAICSQLDEIAEEVLAAIRLEYGAQHPALCVDSELRSEWRRRNIADNQYSVHVSRQVIETVSRVLFNDLGFHGNSELYYCHENSYINKVLEHRRGIPITLSILYESIARRVGIKCEPVSFPGHFLLRWRDTYKEDTPTQCFYIDVFNGGVFLGKDSCPQFSTPSRCPMSEIFRFGPATPCQVVERMASNLEVAGRQRTVMDGRAMRLRSALELLHIVTPANLHCMLQLARFYMQYNMDVSSLRQTIQRVTHFDVRDMGQASYILHTLQTYDVNFCYQLRNQEALEVRRRSSDASNVEYAVGMVMRHLRSGNPKFNYSCVVIGWDPECVASEEWKNQMNVKSLSRQGDQPFYHVLVNDGTNRYAAEENLSYELVPENLRVTHSDIGRYFDSFEGSYYQMNKEMLQAYPDDSDVIRKKININ